MPEIGPTGKFPRGKLNPGDDGELMLGLMAWGGTVILAFGGPVTWLGMSPDDADELAGLLKKRAAEARTQQQ